MQKKYVHFDVSERHFSQHNVHRAVSHKCSQVKNLVTVRSPMYTKSPVQYIGPYYFLTSTSTRK